MSHPHLVWIFLLILSKTQNPPKKIRGHLLWVFFQYFGVGWKSINNIKKNICYWYFEKVERLHRVHRGEVLWSIHDKYVHVFLFPWEKKSISHKNFNFPPVTPLVIFSELIIVGLLILSQVSVFLIVKSVSVSNWYFTFYYLVENSYMFFSLSRLHFFLWPNFLFGFIFGLFTTMGKFISFVPTIFTHFIFKRTIFQ